MSGLANLKRRVDDLENSQHKDNLKGVLEYAEGLKTGQVTVSTARDVGQLVERFLLLADEFPG